MLLTFQDRLRIPWRGGAKQVTFGAIFPIFILPLLISLAAINAYTFTVIFVASAVILCYTFSYVRQRSLRTRFFNMWIISSVVYILLLFEVTVPLLEVLPEENYTLAAFTLISLICFYQAYKRASFNHVKITDTEDGITDITEASNTNENAEQTLILLDQELETGQQSGKQPSICSICRKHIQPYSAHCKVCNACVKRYDHHSYWLNGCIGESNHRFYLTGLIFGILALLLGADLTLTAVCHPFLAANILGVQILLPDDCSEVFDMYELSLAFVIAAYALIMAVYMITILLRQIYFVSRGITLYECNKGLRGNNKTPSNWGSFIS
ncbi:palmitoyltransferase ZDHHC23-B isoform X2 [Eurosta solidaginis]